MTSVLSLLLIVLTGWIIGAAVGVAAWYREV